jgi:hypothetical protein
VLKARCSKVEDQAAPKSRCLQIVQQLRLVLVGNRVKSLDLDDYVIEAEEVDSIVNRELERSAENESVKSA